VKQIPHSVPGALIIIPPLGENIPTTAIESSTLETAVLQLYMWPVIGWPDAPPGLFGLRFIQVAAI
jgi:hypothetical protein